MSIPKFTLFVVFLTVSVCLWFLSTKQVYMYFILKHFLCHSHSLSNRVFNNDNKHFPHIGTTMSLSHPNRPWCSTYSTSGSISLSLSAEFLAGCMFLRQYKIFSIGFLVLCWIFAIWMNLWGSLALRFIQYLFLELGFLFVCWILVIDFPILDFAVIKSSKLRRPFAMRKSHKKNWISFFFFLFWVLEKLFYGTF